jgi:hypothetical protein
MNPPAIGLFFYRLHSMEILIAEWFTEKKTIKKIPSDPNAA